LEFWRLYRLLRQRAWLLALVLVASASGVVIRHLTQRGTYQASAILYPSPNAISFGAGQGTTTGGVVGAPRPRTTAEILGDMAAIIMSRTVLDYVNESRGLRLTPRMYSQLVNVRQKRDTDLLEITAFGTTPQAAADLANAVAEQFQAHYKVLCSTAATNTREVLEGEVESARRRLDQAQRALVTFLKDTGFESVDLIQAASAVNTGQGTPDVLLRDAERRVRSAAAQLAEIERQLAATPEEIDTGQSQERNPVKDTLKQQLTDAQAKLDQELQLRGARHPSVQKLQAQVEQLRQQYEQEPEFVGSVKERERSTERQNLLLERTRVSAELRGAQAELPYLREQASKYASSSRVLPEQVEAYKRLQRDIDLAQAEYDRGFQALYEARRAETIARNQGTVEILERAVASDDAVRASLGRSMALGLMGGLVMTIILVQLIEYLDNRVKTPEDVERLVGLPVIATIPLTAAETRESSRRGQEPGTAGN